MFSVENLMDGSQLMKDSSIRPVRKRHSNGRYQCFRLLLSIYLALMNKKEEELISVSKCQSRKCDHNPKWIIKLLRKLAYLRIVFP